MFDPKTKKYPYTKKTDGHYLEVKKDRGIVFDEKYPYIDDSFGAKFMRGIYRVLLNLIVFPMTRTKLGLKIKGKNVLKENRALIDKGVVSCSNHVHLFDYLAIMCAVNHRKPRVLVWAKNVNGESGNMIRNVGGVPIPEGSVAATIAYTKRIGEYLQKGGWLHIYAEGSMWEFYAPIRPFKRGAAFFACKFDKPIIPMAFSYREPNFIRKKIFRQIACFNLEIGQPIFANKDLPMSERITDLTVRCHDEVCRLAGVDPKENIYPAVFENNSRIDYY